MHGSMTTYIFFSETKSILLIISNQCCVYVYSLFQSVLSDYLLRKIISQDY